MRRFAAALLLLMATPVVAAPEQARFEWFDYRGDDGRACPARTNIEPDPARLLPRSDACSASAAIIYLANSTFSWFPGIPIFRSRDLVHWTQIGNAIDRSSQLEFEQDQHVAGRVAPDLSWHDGTFYLLNTCIDCGGNYL